MTQWQTEQNFCDKDRVQEFRLCMFGIGCDYGRIEIEKHYHYNGGGKQAFGGAEKWPVLSLHVDFETGKEKERNELAEKLKQFIDKVKP